MPYANDSAWRRATRTYLNRKRPDLTKKSYCVYRRALDLSGELFGEPNPRLISLETLRQLERNWPLSESTGANQLRILKDFLVKTGNPEAKWWTVHLQYRPASDSVWLTEEECERVLIASARLGLHHQVLTALTLECGLRPHDMRCMRLQNGIEAVQQRVSWILGKGKNGGKVDQQIFSLNAVQILRWYLEERRELVERSGVDYDALFIRPLERRRGQLRKGDPVPWTYDYQLDLQAEIVSLSNVRKWKLKDNRKTCGHHAWEMNGRDERAAANVLRHSNPSTSFKFYIGAPQQIKVEQMDRTWTQGIRKSHPEATVQQR